MTDGFLVVAFVLGQYSCCPTNQVRLYFLDADMAAFLKNVPVVVSSKRQALDIRGVFEPASKVIVVQHLFSLAHIVLCHLTRELNYT